MKKLRNRIKSVMLIFVSGILLISCLSRCKQDHLTINTSGTVNMYGYIQQDSQFSLFKQIVDKAGYASFLNTYGAYTLFLPNNDGVTAYLKATNTASVDNIADSTAKKLVGIALIADTLSTQNFTDGKLRTPTTEGQYLITGAVNTVVNGNPVTKTVINKQANLVTGNIRVGNGIIHVIDNMIVPAPYTIAQLIENDPKYSIFAAALKATGLDSLLGIDAAVNMNPALKYLTFIAETDSTLQHASPTPFADFNALKARYSNTGNPTKHTDSLWLYMAYHIWPELSFVSDIAILDSHATYAVPELTTSVVQGTDVLLDDTTFNDVHEIGTKIYRPESDISASNGVMHTVLTDYGIKVRQPAAVYFDVGAQPEIIATPGLFRHLGGGSHTYKSGEIAGINLVVKKTTDIGNQLIYNNDGNPSTHYYYWNDWLEVGGRFRTGNGPVSAEFTTPVIVRGQYKIWVDYMYQSSYAQVIPTYFNGVALPNTFNNGNVLNALEGERQAEARGFKWYSDAPRGDSSATNKNPYGGYVGRLLGIVDVPTTDHQKVMFMPTIGSGDAAHFLLDVIEFRPVDMDQLHPRLGHNGNLIP